jgi:hypothetical protein
MSPARLRGNQRRSEQAGGWFTEGLDTGDLNEAENLLEELAA